MAFKIIKNKKFDQVGYLLNEYWSLKKTLSDNVSNTKIDDLFDECIYSGAIGGKICGAGNGGFLLLYVPKKNQKKFENENTKKKFIKVKPDEFGSRIILNNK